MTRLEEGQTGELDPGQAWFWTPEWQAQMAAAQADLDAARSTRFQSGKAFIDALAEERK